MILQTFNYNCITQDAKKNCITQTQNIILNVKTNICIE